MQCQGFTKKGKPCRNQASANGYCHLHGGVATRQARRREFERTYQAMTPEERSSRDSVVIGCILVILALALFYGAITGDWVSVGKWLSR